MVQRRVTPSKSAKVGKASDRAGYHHGDLRRALLDACLAIIQFEGVGHTSLRAVAKRAGVSAAAPYHHFPSREAMLGELASEGFVLFADALLARSRVSPSKDPIEHLASLGRGYLDFAKDYPAHFRLMFLALAEGFPSDTLFAHAGRSFEVLLEGVRKVVPDSQEAQQSLALLVWSATHGAAELMAQGAIGKPSTLFPNPNIANDLIENLMRLVRSGNHENGKSIQKPRHTASRARR
ncbi:MAG: TetR/AcrR family transcriptional regulator [Polyangiaceae bacterium]|nr:TetR/AcrR family transcriptional regulator [Polyangiaceae bacterium]